MRYLDNAQIGSSRLTYIMILIRSDYWPLLTAHGFAYRVNSGRVEARDPNVKIRVIDVMMTYGPACDLETNMLVIKSRYRYTSLV